MHGCKPSMGRRPMSEVEFSPIALVEYDEILAIYPPKIVAKLQGSVRRSMDDISRFPEASPECDDRHRYCAVRKFPYGLIYRYENNTVRIVAVTHNRRMPGFWIDRD